MPRVPWQDLNNVKTGQAGRRKEREVEGQRPGRQHSMCGLGPAAPAQSSRQSQAPVGRVDANRPGSEDEKGSRASIKEVRKPESGAPAQERGPPTARRGGAQSPAKCPGRRAVRWSFLGPHGWCQDGTKNSLIRLVLQISVNKGPC